MMKQELMKGRCHCKNYEIPPEARRLLHRIPFKCACGAEIHFHENLAVCVQGHVQGYWTLEEPQPIETDEMKWKPRRPRGWKYEQGEGIKLVW